MSEKKAKSNRRSLVEVLVPIIVVAVFGVLWLTGALNHDSVSGYGALGTIELKVKDAYTRLAPEAPKLPQVVLIDVDDKAIQDVGMWPWSRDIHANLLLKLKELGASHLTFDIEFVDPSPVGVTSAERDRTIKAKGAEMGEIFGALAEKQLKVDEAQQYADTILNEGIMLTARDNDAQLGRVLRVFQNAVTTLNYDLEEGKPDVTKYLLEHSFLTGVTGDLNSHAIRGVPSLRGAIVPIASQGTRAGVTNVEKDADGTLRRIKLLYRIDGKPEAKDLVFGQLAFTPVWDYLGRPPVDVQENYVVLRTSQLKENPRPDIAIPLDPRGFMLINWPHNEYKLTLTHVYVSRLLELDQAETALHEVIYNDLRANGYLGDNDFTGLWDEAQAAYQTTLAQGDPAQFETYKQKHAAYLEAVGQFANGAAERSILDSLEAAKADPKASDKDKQSIDEIKATVGPNFKKLRDAFTAYMDLRKEMQAKLDKAICFMGWSSSATTDVGVNPFDSNYFNVGTHASIANTILSGSFINEIDPAISYLIGAVLALGMILISSRFKTIMAAVIGMVLFFALLFTVGLVYRFTGTYIGALMPGLTLFVTVVALTFIRFFSSEKDKAFLRNSFQSYLSPAVIDQIIANPDMLNLGGEKKFMTAMFTDVKGFSTFSEKLDPNDLVKLLNRYLTIMSDLILETGGTIDKFEGDAIIAFWGAPITLVDHARRTARTAVLMKRAEKALNEELKAEGMAPMYTRIGINTGDMTVGNMGTAKRMDYTMMGNAVNLAARLEGVNKQYTTWILTSQATRDELGDEFLVRRLDRVRVVGISTPVRLYQVVDILAEADPAVKELIATFEAGLDRFEERDWVKSEKLFQDVLKINPEDGPALKYLDRAVKYQTEPPAPDWDGVYSMTEK